MLTTSHQPFNWFVDFYGIMKSGGFNVVIGNPPYVEYKEVKSAYTIIGYSTEKCGNLFSFVVERGFHLCQQQFSRYGMIVPHSGFCTERMSPFVSLFDRSRTWISTYDIRPSKLFNGVDQRLSIFITAPNTKRQFSTTSYRRWNEEQRDDLFATLQYLSSAPIPDFTSIPKVQRTIEQDIWKKLVQNDRSVDFSVGNQKIFFHNAPRYWIRVMNFTPYFWNERVGEQISTQVKRLSLDTNENALAIVAILNSSLFYWWFILLSDCRHLNMREIETFPVSLLRMSSGIKRELGRLALQLMEDLKRNAKRKEAFYKTTGQVKYDEFYPRFSKPIIDQIDRALAVYYGFTEEECDFIVNFDIKYRLGSTPEKEEYE